MTKKERNKNENMFTFDLDMGRSRIGVHTQVIHLFVDDGVRATTNIRSVSMPAHPIEKSNPPQNMIPFAKTYLYSSIISQCHRNVKSKMNFSFPSDSQCDSRCMWTCIRISVECIARRTRHIPNQYVSAWVSHAHIIFGNRINDEPI